LLKLYTTVKDGSEYYGVENKPSLDKYKKMYDKTKEFFMRPMRKGEIKKLNKRYLNTYDIDWRNTELLTEFLYGNGQIKNRYQTKLNSRQ
jgi:ribosomal protein S18